MQGQDSIDTGSICGTVQNETGAPASLTKVTAIYVGGPHTGPFQSSKTDENGHYCVTGLQLGDYAMSASDSEKGYPLLEYAFYAEHSPEPGVTISSDRLHAHLDWRIPYKAGFLRVVLADSRTGQPVKLMQTKLSVRFAETSRYLHAGRASDEVLLLPPNEDVFVNVSAPGYESWPAGEIKGRLVNLQPGATQTLEVALQPAAP